MDGLSVVYIANLFESFLVGSASLCVIFGYFTWRRQASYSKQLEVRHEAQEKILSLYEKYHTKVAVWLSVRLLIEEIENGEDSFFDGKEREVVVAEKLQSCYPMAAEAEEFLLNNGALLEARDREILWAFIFSVNLLQHCACEMTIVDFCGINSDNEKKKESVLKK